MHLESYWELIDVNSSKGEILVLCWVIRVLAPTAGPGILEVEAEPFLLPHELRGMLNGGLWWRKKDEKMKKERRVAKNEDDQDFSSVLCMLTDYMTCLLLISILVFSLEANNVPLCVQLAITIPYYQLLSSFELLKRINVTVAQTVIRKKEKE